MNKIVTLKEIVACNNFGENFWRQGLCRSEFYKHVAKIPGSKYVYTDSPEFRQELKNYLMLKRKV